MKDKREAKNKVPPFIPHSSSFIPSPSTFIVLEDDEGREGLGDEAARCRLDFRFDDDAGPAFMNDICFGETIFVVDRADVIDLHL